MPATSKAGHCLSTPSAQAGLSPNGRGTDHVLSLLPSEVSWCSKQSSVSHPCDDIFWQFVFL